MTFQIQSDPPPWLVTRNVDAPYLQPTMHEMFAQKNPHLQNATTLLTRPTKRFWVCTSFSTSCPISITLTDWQNFYLEAQIKKWTSSCYAHFKTPIIVKENGEIKYQFVCCTYMFYFFLQSCLTFQTETLPLSSPGNARKIQPWTFCVMSNHVKAKLSMPRRASQTMHMVWCTARPNCTTSSHFGFSNATDPSPLSTMSHYNRYSK